MTDKDKGTEKGTEKAPAPREDASPDERRSAWKRVQELFDKANDAVIEYQKRFARVGSRIAPGPPIIPDTPAHRRGQEKRQRHADAYADGTMSLADIANERQAEWSDRFAQFPDADRALLNDWASRQDVLSGSPIGVVNHHAVPWPLVFLAGRYGEEVEHWPTQLSYDDRQRITHIDRGGKPVKGSTTLRAAVAAKASGTRKYLFAHPKHARHVDRAVQAHAAQSGKPANGQGNR